MAKKDKKSIEYLLKGELEDNKKLPKKLRRFLNYSLVILAAGVLGYAFYAFFFCTVFMTGPSMEGTLYHNDELILSKCAYMIKDVERYDIVAIQRFGSNEYYDIKRVIGLPGDTVSVVGGILVVNGQQVDDDIPCKYVDQMGRLNRPIKLGDGEYFVLGDNPEHSEDSRFVNFGNVQENEIKGKIIYRILPKERSGKIR
jgi:signal peptidase I, bacterial type